LTVDAATRASSNPSAASDVIESNARIARRSSVSAVVARASFARSPRRPRRDRPRFGLVFRIFATRALNIPPPRA